MGWSDPNAVSHLVLQGSLFVLEAQYQEAPGKFRVELAPSGLYRRVNVTRVPRMREPVEKEDIQRVAI